MKATLGSAIHSHEECTSAFFDAEDVPQANHIFAVVGHAISLPAMLTHGALLCIDVRSAGTVCEGWGDGRQERRVGSMAEGRSSATGRTNAWETQDRVSWARGFDEHGAHAQRASERPHPRVEKKAELCSELR